VHQVGNQYIVDG